MPVFQCEDLTYFYSEREKPALKSINLHVEEGDFLLITGGSGSGKSSLARALAGLIPYFYGGRLRGRVYFDGRDVSQIDRRLMAREVGMVFQDPEKQLVMTSVEAEVAFGLENLGLPREEMVRRVAEALSFLDLAGLREEFTAHLSGGQKQKLALAAVLAMQPRVLILDEPTSQLDPVASEEFLNLVKRLNEEMGLTIILIEQRLERCFHLADRVVFMEDGQIRYDGTPGQLASWAAARDIPFIPPVASFFARNNFATIPVTVKEGRRLLRQNFRYCKTPPVRPVEKKDTGKPVLVMDNVWFAYPGGREALQDINLRIFPGELAAVLGNNGAGKSTLLKTMAGLLKPTRGRLMLDGRDLNSEKRFVPGRVAYLSQNPNDYLFQETVEEELHFTLKNFGLTDDGVVNEYLEKLELIACRKANPRDLSSGERQRAALASILVTRPRVLVLDEPTRGMDGRLKDELGKILSGLCREGASVVLVTHDVEFAAVHATRVLMMFAGRLVADGPKKEVLGSSYFYTTQIGKMCRGFADGVLTLADALASLELLWPNRKQKGEARFIT
ncbi:ABC transporter ATP-binding protein [Moorella sulfitireducens]|uniref:ABC transporter ATP-binding protein n=1 Tax=Neomoorella sulfitireducens TaxID=2972948 RepID=UPI0021ABE9C2|nr:ABC transporter ATP-binding protein [Moorella sulfitireducens]